MDPIDDDERGLHQQRLKQGPSGVATGKVITILGRTWLLNRQAISQFRDFSGEDWHCTVYNYYGPLGYAVQVRYLLDDPSCNAAETNHPRSFLVLALKVVFIALLLTSAVFFVWMVVI